MSSSRRTVRLGSLQGVYERFLIKKLKLNQVDTSHTGRSVQGRAPVVALSLWVCPADPLPLRSRKTFRAEGGGGAGRQALEGRGLRLSPRILYISDQVIVGPKGDKDFVPYGRLAIKRGKGAPGFASGL